MRPWTACSIASVAGDRRFVTMAMYQGGSVALPSDVTVVAPLYREVVHVLVKKDLLDNLETVNQDDPEMNHDLLRELLIVQKKEIHVGKEDSGMRFSAMETMDHYGLSTEEVVWRCSKGIAHVPSPIGRPGRCRRARPARCNRY